jgi:Tfp pilus assembly protein PilV
MLATPGRRTVASQDGFALMEVIIAAAVLVLVVLGVFAGLDAVTSTAGANKARTVAATLAEKDQERLRGMRTSDIDKMNTAPYDVKVGNVTYHVESNAAWVYDASGDEVSCGIAKGQASYMRITSTVTSPITGAKVKPIVISSIVAPQVGASAAGSLAVMVKGAAGQPVPGVAVSAPPHDPELTNSLGCAVFGDLTAGTYKVSLSKTGYVDKEGVTNPTNDVTVTAGNMSTVEFAYDIAASITLNVKTKKLAGADEPAKSVVAANGQLGAGLRVWNAPSTSPYTSLKDTVTAGTFYSDKAFLLTNLFPFVDGYTFYSGGCIFNDPSKFVTGIDYFGTYGGKQILAPGENGGAIEVYEPVSSILVKKGTAPDAKTVNVYAYPTNAACDETRIFLGTTKTDGSGTLTYAGLPYGDYTLCAYRPGSTDYRATTTLTVKDPLVPAAPTLTLGTTARDCGDTAADSTP